MKIVTVELGLRTRSLNAMLRQRQRARSRQNNRERQQVALALLAHRHLMPPGGRPVAVTMTRISPRLMDDDNVTGGLKVVRDTIAAYFRTSDGPGGIRWTCGQERGSPARLRLILTFRASRQMVIAAAERPRQGVFESQEASEYPPGRKGPRRAK